MFFDGATSKTFKVALSRVAYFNASPNPIDNVGNMSYQVWLDNFSTIFNISDLSPNTQPSRIIFSRNVILMSHHRKISVSPVYFFDVTPVEIIVWK